MKILVAGAHGQVGREFQECVKLTNKQFEIVNVARQQLDITNIKQVEKTITENQPSIVINAAAYTAVDKAEEEIDLAFAINRDGAANLAKVCGEQDIPLVHVSTDYVFDGKKIGAYLETDEVNPVSVYGQSKLEGEQQVQQLLGKHIILRTSWVFGPFGNNFVYTIVRLAKQKQELTIVSDQFGCPTSANSIASAILSICEVVESDNDVSWGVYHYCGSPRTNWFDFSKAIVENSRQYQDYSLKNIRPISTSDYPTAATRPQNSVLSCDKIHGEFNIVQQPWIEGLNEMFTHPQFIARSN